VLPPSTGNGRRGKVYVSFQLSDLREIKNHLESYTDAQTNTFTPSSLTQTFKLAQKDIMFLLDQTLFSLEKQWVLAQAIQVRNDYHLQ
jgi:hypothetical protein